ncbi:unnamed protein product [Rotaria magnacalcarata]|uniref:HMG box domain-containing protein n=3 Tax=Rotaria magnacalcarata TaxID=392030 RepID=A0A819SWG5_9BILA|nr:unnamed protein product [Rotaria magnacalcarata]CAF2037643.1 unnamed protein product [Rotaria magnacalcarata]CAF2054382.1 unnamed protein product [Rotaria magnacalcarata]CAF4067833.1 unnamed protein product [Rotaria magnacalcarata]CAF4157520.1 unnamed protein product [Rotaria magnacalcarata]
MHQISTKQQQNTATIMLDEYCRYYSDFSKILGIYIKYFHPQLHFEVEQLLEASYNVWHHLSDDTKISLANFLEEINRESNRTISSASKITTFNNLINSELFTKKLKHPVNFTRSKIDKINSKAIALNTSSCKTMISKMNNPLVKKPISITPFNIYLKDERRKLISKHRKMSIHDINKRLSERWKKMSNRMKQTYEYRSYLAKKRLYKKQGKSIKLRKPSFIKRNSSKTKQIKNKNQQLSNTFRTQ